MSITNHTKTAMKHLRTLSLLLLLLLGWAAFSSCSDDKDDAPNEFANWRQRNADYFDSIRMVAQGEIRQARNAYGDQWADYCNWRAYLAYSLDTSRTHESTDSIYAYVLQQGEGTVCPMSTDSCRVFYLCRLIPSDSYPNGYVVDHSGQSSKYDEIFDLTHSVPALLRPTSGIYGFGTALQHMHVGDRWRVYVPQQLGYEGKTSASVPAYSTLVFDMQLRAFYRKGTPVGPYN